MSDDAGMESLGLGDAKEADAAAIEQMRENMRKAGEALKKSQRDEAKKKKKEKTLVALLIKFLQANNNDDILALIILLLEQKVPVDFILAILTLGYPSLEVEFMEAFGPEEQALISSAERQESELETSLVEKEKLAFDKENLPPYVKAKINDWVKLLIFGSLESKDEILKYLYPEGKLLVSSLTLCAHMIVKYCATVNITADLDSSKDFAKFILVGLKNQIENTK